MLTSPCTITNRNDWGHSHSTSQKGMDLSIFVAKCDGGGGWVGCFWSVMSHFRTT